MNRTGIKNKTTPFVNHLYTKVESPTLLYTKVGDFVA